MADSKDVDLRKTPAILPAVIGLSGFCFGLLAVASWFVESMHELAPIFAIFASICALGAGWAAFRMASAVNLAETEVNRAIDLLVAQARQTPDESGMPVIDPDTELPGQHFFELAVKGRVAAARRHLWPISVVLIDVKLHEGSEKGNERVEALKEFVVLLKQTLRESDLACKLSDNSFGLILDDTSEEGGVWTAERIQITLAKNVSKVRQIAAGVATYPTHALHADEILKRANTALARAAATAASDGLGHVEVAHVDLG